MKPTNEENEELPKPPSNVSDQLCDDNADDDESEQLDEYDDESPDNYSGARGRNIRPTAAVGGLAGGTGSSTKK
ncbi:hypothetical protein HYPSUDRAFT_40976 [Hypholoma sublateritium FD-334 SS-4]|uniref:Uncharacterized protein n=1 Tax=Hypholoma sublateritium (strain FD-334 SS-4) TaxID=945553 RepID=A0A0D2P1J5_HYPSF|nr:hypothetical protein HYPSUDRAFT_40976 [Hypholoma sublateritium FD-334 SS-4]